MSNPTILVTGGTGKTGSRIAARLQASGHKTRVASRQVATDKSSSGHVRFDWADASSYDNALADVWAIYAVAPQNVADPLDAMRPFLERALTFGARRFVLLSASSLEEGGPMMGAVHSYLKQVAPEWAVLRPTWFMQNFSEQQHLPTIRDEGRIYSATADGRVPFVDAGDIAAVGVSALINATPFNRDIIITGPQSLSYGEAAAILSNIIGRPIEHIRLSEEQLVQRYESQGMENQYAKVLAAMDIAIAGGSEDRLSDEVATITGKRPKDLAAFASQNHAVWKVPAESSLCNSES